MQSKEVEHTTVNKPSAHGSMVKNTDEIPSEELMAQTPCLSVSMPRSLGMAQRVPLVVSGFWHKSTKTLPSVKVSDIFSSIECSMIPFVFQRRSKFVEPKALSQKLLRLYFNGFFCTNPDSLLQPSRLILDERQIFFCLEIRTIISLEVVVILVLRKR